MSADSSRQSRVRPAIRRLAIIAFPLLLLLAAHAVWDFIEVRRVASEIDRIVRKGEPITYAVAVRPSGREQEGADDASRYYLSAALLAVQAADIVDAYGRFGSVQAWLSGRADRPDLSPVITPTNEFLNKWGAAFDLLDTGAERAFYVFPPGTEYNYQAAGLSNLTRLNAVRTLHASARGDGDAAVRSAIVGVRLRRALREGLAVLGVEHQIPSLLSLTRASRRSLEALQRTLDQETDIDYAADDLVRQRAKYLDMARQLTLARDRQVLPSLLAAPWRPVDSRDVSRTLREWAELIDVARTPWPERAKRAAPLLARPDPAPVRLRLRMQPLRPMYVPSIYYFRAAIRPDRLILDRSTKVAVAIERYRRDHADAVPPALGALVPQYVQAIPADPLTGLPLRYHVTEESYAVYSVGLDGEDDGGEKLQTTAGAPGSFDAAADVGVRVMLSD